MAKSEGKPTKKKTAAKNKAVAKKKVASKKATAKKATSKKAPAKKTTTKKAAAKKKAPAKKKVAKKAAGRAKDKGVRIIGADDRRQMIAEAAYLRGEAQGFLSNEHDDWLLAEAEVDALLAKAGVKVDGSG